MFSDNFIKSDESTKLVSDIDIKAINSWRMEAIVADKMMDSSEQPHIFLAGDSAHAFPPSGGFGLNTGIGDAQNISHKLAFAIRTGYSNNLQ